MDSMFQQQMSNNTRSIFISRWEEQEPLSLSPPLPGEGFVYILDCLFGLELKILKGNVLSDLTIFKALRDLTIIMALLYLIKALLYLT